MILNMIIQLLSRNLLQLSPPKLHSLYEFEFSIVRTTSQSRLQLNTYPKIEQYGYCP